MKKIDHFVYPSFFIPFKKSRKPLRFFGYIFLSLISCISPFDVTTTYQQGLVVQGMITDQPGPYLVTLSSTIPINNQLGESGAVTGATIVIRDDQGEQETLIEKSPGNYYTQTIQGVVGGTYSITITTSDGNSYQSTDEKILPVGDFSNLRFEFVQNEPAGVNQQITSTNGFNIYLDSEVLPEQKGLVWWRWTGTFQILTFPSLHTVPGNGKVITPVPAPPLCSGYIVSHGMLQYYTPCSCCDCWVSQYNQIPIISNPNLVNNGKINDLNIAFIEANRRTMYNKYYLEIDQYSVSQVVYTFWKNVQTQLNNSSNLFQIPPAKTGGNLIGTTPHALPVTGYFAASAVKTHSIEMSQLDVPYPILPIDTLAMSCTQVFPNSTTQKPLFW